MDTSVNTDYVRRPLRFPFWYVCTIVMLWTVLCMAVIFCIGFVGVQISPDPMYVGLLDGAFFSVALTFVLFVLFAFAECRRQKQEEARIAARPPRRGGRLLTVLSLLPLIPVYPSRLQTRPCRVRLFLDLAGLFLALPPALFQTEHV